MRASAGASFPLRYRRKNKNLREDRLIWDYTIQQMQELAAEVVPRRHLSRLWERLMTEIQKTAKGVEEYGAVLDASRLRLVPDTLRLQPVELEPKVLMAVLSALANGQALYVLYENAKNERSMPVLHPQALVQRGPIPYLFALKNEEDDLRMYALQRMIRAEVLTEVKARQAQDFDLDEAIKNGRVDFGKGDWINLELLVRGYLTEVIKACPLDPKQTWRDEPEDSEFEIRVRAKIPSNGQLLRWLLGAGDNVEVVAPPELRQTLASQAAKMAGIYGVQPSSDSEHDPQ